MTQRAIKTFDFLQDWQDRLNKIANEMEAAGSPDLLVLAEHIDSITSDLTFQKQEQK